MSVYMIIDAKINDEQKYRQYVQKATKIVQHYNGKYLSRGSKIITLSKNWNPQRIVIIKFESLEKLQTCFKSKQYLEIKHLREESCESKAVIVEDTID